MVLNTEHYRALHKPTYNWDKEIQEATKNGVALIHMQDDQIERGRELAEIVKVDFDEFTVKFFLMDAFNRNMIIAHMQTLDIAIEKSKKWQETKPLHREVIILNKTYDMFFEPEIEFHEF